MSPSSRSLQIAFPATVLGSLAEIVAKRPTCNRTRPQLRVIGWHVRRPIVDTTPRNSRHAHESPGCQTGHSKYRTYQG